MIEQFGNLDLTDHDLSAISRDLLMAGVLQELALALPALQDRDRLLLDSASSAAMLLDASEAEILLLDAERLLLHGQLDQLQAPDVEHCVPVGRGLIGQMAVTGRPVICNQPTADLHYDPSVDHVGGVPVRSLMGVPLQFRERLIGVLLVANRERPFTNQDLRWLVSLAAIITAAYENINLIERLRTEQERLLRAEEELRRKLARDLHDGATQRIAAAKMEVDYLRRLVVEAPTRVGAELDLLDGLLDRAMQLLRTALFDLRPLILETEGLEQALRRYVREHSEERGPELRLQVSGKLPRLQNNTGSALFAIVQEAVNNARKHAGATLISISLRRQTTRLIIVVRDDGRGFKPAEIAANYAFGTSFGMRNMRELVDAIGGTFMLTSTPGRGTKITISVPVPAEANETRE